MDHVVRCLNSEVRGSASMDKCEATCGLVRSLPIHLIQQCKQPYTVNSRIHLRAYTISNPSLLRAASLLGVKFRCVGLHRMALDQFGSDHYRLYFIISDRIGSDRKVSCRVHLPPPMLSAPLRSTPRLPPQQTLPGHTPSCDSCHYSFLLL